MNSFGVHEIKFILFIFLFIFAVAAAIYGLVWLLTRKTVQHDKCDQKSIPLQRDKKEKSILIEKDSTLDKMWNNKEDEAYNSL